VEFADPADYDKIECDDEIEISNLPEAIKSRDEVKIVNGTKSFEFVGKLELSGRDREILLSGGLLSYTRQKSNA
jgi:aconitate hydratase